MTCKTEIGNRPLEPKANEIEAVALSSVDPNVVADPPPDGGYGWICVASVFIINGFTWGVTAVRFPPEPMLDGIFNRCSCKF